MRQTGLKGLQLRLEALNFLFQLAQAIGGRRGIAAGGGGLGQGFQIDLATKQVGIAGFPLARLPGQL